MKFALLTCICSYTRQAGACIFNLRSFQDSDVGSKEMKQNMQGPHDKASELNRRWCQRADGPLHSFIRQNLQPKVSGGWRDCSVSFSVTRFLHFFGPGVETKTKAEETRAEADAHNCSLHRVHV